VAVCHSASRRLEPSPGDGLWAARGSEEAEARGAPLANMVYDESLANPDALLASLAAGWEPAP